MTRVRCRLAALLVLSLSSLPLPAADAVEALAARIDAHLDQPRFAAAAWGISVVSLDSGKQVYARNADRLLTPASTAKLYTAALALATFGPDHRVATSLFTTTKANRDGDLHGDLVLVGYGDPMLGHDKRVSWADTLAIAVRKSGIVSVRGGLVGDATWFTGPLHGDGWEAGDLQSWFGAPASALAVDDNVVRVEVMPGPNVGSRARIRFGAEHGLPILANEMRTVAAGEMTDISLHRAPGASTLHAFGPIARDAGPHAYRLAMHDPALAAVEQLRAALLRQGVVVAGPSRSVYWPQRDEALDGRALHRVADVWSPTIAEIVERGLKVSQNLYMQNLLLMVGAKSAADERAGGSSGLPFRSSATRGIEALRRFLASIGIAPDRVLIEDGAGLSRRNLTTPRALTDLLAHHGRAPEALAFRVALPEAGVDGSLTGRMLNSSAQGRLHAKTGSMNYTWSLAGYVRTQADERLAFALMLNNYQPPRNGTRMPRPSAELDAIAILLASLDERSGTPATPAPDAP